MSQIQIPEGWQCVKLGDREFFKDIIGGGTPARERSDYFGGEIPWIRLSDMKSKYVDQTKETLTENGLRNSSAKIVPKNTVILSTRATIGEVAIANTNLCTNQGFKAIICNEEKVLPEYVYYFLKSIKHVLQSKSKSTTYSEINKTNLENIEIGIPSVEIQKKIVKKVDNIFKELEVKRETILELQKKKKIKIEKLLKNSWSSTFEYLINDAEGADILLGELLTDIKLGSNSKAFEDKNGIPVLRMPNIQNGHIDYSSLKYTKFSPQDEEKYLLKKCDILVNRTNSPELVGKSAVFDSNEKFAFASYLIRIRVDVSRVSPYFLTTYINSNLGRKYVESVYVKTAGQANINSQHLKSMPILLPDLRKQKMIMKKITPLLYSEISELSTLLKQSLISQDTLKQKFNNLSTSILRTAFSGKLVN